MRNIILAIVVLIAATVVVGLTVSPFSSGSEVYAEDAYIHGAVADIGVRFDSRVKLLYVREGDKVKRGDIVAELDSAHLHARSRALQAQVARRRAEYESAQVAIRLDSDRTRLTERQSQADISAARAALQAARASETLARREFDRTQQLLADGIVPRARLERVRETLLTAQADVRESNANLEAARRGTDLATVELRRNEALQADLLARLQAWEAASAELEIAEANLDAATVRAPHDGMIVNIAARAGSSVRPNDAIVSIWDERRLWVHAWVPETEIARLRPGSDVRVDINALGAEDLSGQVEAVLVAPDGKQRTLPGQPISPLLPDRPRFAVRISLSADTNALPILPGMSVDVRILPQQN